MWTLGPGSLQFLGRNLLFGQLWLKCELARVMTNLSPLLREGSKFRLLVCKQLILHDLF